MTASCTRSHGQDVTDRHDIALLVRTFYTHAFADPLLGPVFVDIAHLDLDVHLPIMCDFWETVLFQAGKYHGNALWLHRELHARAHLTPEHFNRWLTIWTQTIDSLYTGLNADRAKLQAERIGASIQRRLLGQSGSELNTLRPRTIESLPGSDAHDRG